MFQVPVRKPSPALERTIDSNSSLGLSGHRSRNEEGEQARKDREALAKVADVVLEILVSSREIIVPEVSGNRSYSVPDIQATAIRLEDSRILGQATASDILGQDRFAGRVVRNYDVREITEATALALMEDMMIGVVPVAAPKPPPAAP